MQLWELRQALLSQLGQRFFQNTAFSNVSLNKWINFATQQVANLVAAKDQGLFLVDAQATVPASPTSPWHRIDFYGAAPDHFAIPSYKRVRRVRRLYRRDHPAAGDWSELKLIHFEDRGKYAGTSASDLPVGYVFGQGIELVKPSPNLLITMDYEQQVPFMFTDSDTPGQTNGLGTANLIPEDYHHLIVITAAVWVLAAENSSALAGAVAIYRDMQQQLGLTLVQQPTEVTARGGGFAAIA